MPSLHRSKASVAQLHCIKKSTQQSDFVVPPISNESLCYGPSPPCIGCLATTRLHHDCGMWDFDINLFSVLTRRQSNVRFRIECWAIYIELSKSANRWSWQRCSSTMKTIWLYFLIHFESFENTNWASMLLCCRQGQWTIHLTKPLGFKLNPNRSHNTKHIVKRESELIWMKQND